MAFPRGRCQTYLIYKKAAQKFSLRPGWERIFEPLELTEDQRELGRWIGGYYEAAFQHWSLGLSPVHLRHLFLNLQLTELTELLDQIIAQYSPLVESRNQIMRGELAGHEENVARQKSSVLREHNFEWYNRAVSSLSHARNQAQKEFERSVSQIDEVWRALRELRETIVSVNRQRPGPTLQTLLQLQIVTVLFVTEVKVLVGGPDRGDSLRRNFGVSYGFDRAELRGWLAKIRRDPIIIPDLPVITGEIRRRLMKADELGNVVVPVIEPLAPALKLALGFLPVEFVTLGDPDDIWKRPSIWPGGGPPKSPKAWAKTISESWNIWYLMLGGQLREALSIHQPTLKRRQSEDLIHATLSVLRFGGFFPEGHAWSDAAKTLEVLNRDTVFISQARSLIPNHYLISEITTELQNDRPEAESYDPSPEQLAAALDLLIARLNAHPKLADYSSPLIYRLKRYPVDSLQRKWMERQRPNGRAANRARF